MEAFVQNNASSRPDTFVVMRSNKVSFIRFESVKYPESHLVEWPLERRDCLNSRTKVANKDRQQKQIFPIYSPNIQIYKHINMQIIIYSKEIG